MKVSFIRTPRKVVFGVLFVSFSLISSIAQEQTPKAPEQSDEVIRINSELVRTDVTVVDKQGRFVEGLTRDQFELRVDGKIQPVAFFDLVTSGTERERQQLAIDRSRASDQPQGTTVTRVPTNSTERNRIIFFFVDDVHLGTESLGRTKLALLRFVDKQMSPVDRIAIVSTSGQIGFLQQLTDNKAVLREAIARLHFKKNIESTSIKVPISDSDANLVANHRDVGLFHYLVEATQNEFQTDAFRAAMIVRERIRQINAQSRVAENLTLLVLESLMRSSAPLVGRKLVFFVSDGFLVDVKKSNAPVILQRVVTEATRVGAVVYTLDSRAMFSDLGVTAMENGYPDFSSRQGGRRMAESKMPQEPLETLADETGGRSILNSNYFDKALAQAIQETSEYYLLDWKPDSDNQRSGKARLEVIIKGRPELRVNVRRHFFDLNTNATVATASKTATPATPEEALQATIGSLYPHNDVPTSLSAGFVRTPEGNPLLNVAMQLNGSSLNFEPTAESPQGKNESEVDVLGIALDDRGSFATFRQKLTVKKDVVMATEDRSVQWSQSLKLPPGLYQVRVAVRERSTGRTGSAMQWLEIPKLDDAKLAMSSIFVGADKSTGPTASKKVPIKVDARFNRNMRIRFQSFVYSVSGGNLDLEYDVKVIHLDGAVFTVPSEQVRLTGTSDPSSMLLSGDLDVTRLGPGQYTLQISATSKATKNIASQQVQFTVE